MRLFLGVFTVMLVGACASNPHVRKIADGPGGSVVYAVCVDGVEYIQVHETSTSLGLLVDGTVGVSTNNNLASNTIARNPDGSIKTCPQEGYFPSEASEPSGPPSRTITDTNKEDAQGAPSLTPSRVQ